MTKIYTKTGDKGKTALFTGDRVSKSDCNIQALGDIDECNSAIGAALALLPPEPTFEAIRHQLDIIQHALFDVGAAVATPLTRATSRKLAMTRFDHAATAQLESWIDEHSAALPPLSCFILPNGHPAGAMAHLSRAVCRRAERSAYPLYERGDISEEVLIYLNRLSDYLFVVSRRINHMAGRPETPWRPHQFEPLMAP